MKLLAVAVAACICVVAAVNPPVFPKSYILSGTMSLPYANMKEPITLRYDGTNGRARVDFYNGLDYWVYRNDLSAPVTYEVYTRVNAYACAVTQNDRGTNISLPTLVPDLTKPGWTYAGVNFVNNIRVQQWTFFEDHGSKSNMYTFSVNTDGAFPYPVQYNMTGRNAIYGSHTDVYIMDYAQLIPTTFGPSDFVADASCSSASVTPASQVKGVSSTAYLIDMFPSSDDQGARGPHHAFDGHNKRHGKQYPSEDEYERRHALLVKNLAYIHAHNAKHASYQMHVNMFADMEIHELKGTRFAAQKGLVGKHTPAPSTFVHDGSAVAASVDWCAQGKCTRVKDQAFCGSCWAFATTTTIESAYAIKYGKLVTLSPQQLVDCTWSGSNPNYENFGCDGGFFAGAGDSLLHQNMGIMLDSAYPYIGQDGKCSYDASQFNVKISSYTNITAGDEASLIAAVAQQPVGVAIEVASSMLYYANGIYTGDDCSSQNPPNPNVLDHAVLVTGYTDAGIVVRNSWSTYWGDNGFITFARGKNTCGVATSANTVTVV